MRESRGTQSFWQQPANDRPKPPTLLEDASAKVSMPRIALGAGEC